MSLAPASSRGAFLNARLAVNGIQCAARSLGTLTAAGRGLLSSMGASSFGGLVVRTLSASARLGNAVAPRYFGLIGRADAQSSLAPSQNTSPSESSVSSHSSGS